MTAPTQSLKEIFLAALEVAPELREKWLSVACGDDVGMRQQLMRMLEAHDAPHRLLDQSAGVVELAAGYAKVAATEPNTPFGVGTEVGPYKLLQQIGEGGMGTVYMAEQTHPVRRMVAVKVIKPGMDSRLVIARFEAERQALAMMDHLNIARVLDAGTTDEGRPYFVMELLTGTPITEFCDDRRLTPRQRLELFIPVCQAVQHAHQKGIIHRDIKPSNVLIVLYDDRPVPKIIDFGIAKATGMALTEQTLNTGFSLIGTPEYMSPEQATLDQFDIDTRSDIYSLGVLLYELLAGITPFRRQEFEKAGLLEILRVIREDEPPRPSTKAATTGTLPSIAAKRGVDPSRLCGLLRNDLDWIVMKTLEKDRSRRYETANLLMADIYRYLDGEAVLAHPPSHVYRLRKFARKNKGPMFAATSVFTALLAGMIGTTLGLLDARENRKLANQQRDRAIEAERETKVRAEELQLVANFQEGMLQQIDPNLAGMDLSSDVKRKLESALARFGYTANERNTRIDAFMDQWKSIQPANVAGGLIDRTILKPAIQSIDMRFEDQPLVAAQLRQSLATAYERLGLYESARALQEKILTTRIDLQGDEHPETLRATHSMGSILLSLGRTTEAEPVVRKTLALRRRVLGSSHQETISSLNNLGGLLLDQGKLAEAEPILREAFELSRQSLSEQDMTAINAGSNLGMLLWVQGKWEEAETLLRSTITKRRVVLGDLHHDTLYSKVNLAGLLSSQGKLQDAEQLLRDTLDEGLLLLGTDHPTTLVCVTGLGRNLVDQGKLSEAEPFVTDAFERCPTLLGERHKTTLVALETKGLLLQDQGKPDEAEPVLREVLQRWQQIFGDDHPGSIRALDRLGSLLWHQGKLAESKPLTEEALARSRRILGEDHPTTLHLRNDLAALYWSLKQFDQSIPIFEDLVNRSEAKNGRSDQSTLTLMANLGVNYKDAGRLADAIPLLGEVHEASGQNPSLSWVSKQLLNAYIIDHHVDEASKLLAELVARSRNHPPAGSIQLAGELVALGESYLRIGLSIDAEPLLRQSLEICEQTETNDWRSFYIKFLIGEALAAQAKMDEANALLKEGFDGLAAEQSALSPAHLASLKAAIERIMTCFSEREMPDQLALWRSKLDEIERTNRP